MRNNYMKLKRNTYDMNEHVRYFFDKNKESKGRHNNAVISKHTGR